MECPKNETEWEWTDYKLLWLDMLDGSARIVCVPPGREITQTLDGLPFKKFIKLLVQESLVLLREHTSSPALQKDLKGEITRRRQERKSGSA